MYSDSPPHRCLSKFNEIATILNCSETNKDTCDIKCLPGYYAEVNGELKNQSTALCEAGTHAFDSVCTGKIDAFLFLYLTIIVSFC